MTIETKDKDLKNFAAGAFVLFLLLGAYFYYKEKIEISYIMGGISALFLLIRLIRFSLVKPLYIGWMRFAHILGMVNTRIILFVVFVLTVIPIGILLKIFGKDILDKKLDKSSSTYWVDRPVKEMDVKHYERHF